MPRCSPQVKLSVVQGCFKRILPEVVYSCHVHLWTCFCIVVNTLLLLHVLVHRQTVQSELDDMQRSTERWLDACKKMAQCMQSRTVRAAVTRMTDDC